MRRRWRNILKISMFWLRTPNMQFFRSMISTMGRFTCLTPRPSPVNGKPILIGFYGADTSSDAELTLVREIERTAGLAQRLADCRHDPCDPAKVQHGLCDIIHFRIILIGAGYDDGNDATVLRHDPSFRIALERGPETGPALCSQPTISRVKRRPLDIDKNI